MRSSILFRELGPPNDSLQLFIWSPRDHNKELREPRNSGCKRVAGLCGRKHLEEGTGATPTPLALDEAEALL